MRLENLIAEIRITSMGYSELLEKISSIREARVNYVPRVTKKKQIKSKRRRKSDVEKLFDKMSEEERAELIKELGEQENAVTN